MRCRGYAPSEDAPVHAKQCQGAYTRSVTALERCTTYDKANGTFVCRHCNGAERYVLAELQRLREHGLLHDRIRSWADYKDRLAQRLDKDDPLNKKDPRALAFARNKGRPEAMIAARRDGRVEMRGVTAVRAQMAARWRHEVTLRVDVCRWCGKLLLYYATAPDAPYRHHAACYHAARQTPEGRAWLSRRRKALLAGLTQKACDDRFGPNVPVPARPGKQRTVEDLTRNFRWTVRHLLGGETLAALADEADVSRSAVTHRIKDVITLLPDPELATGHFRTYIEALREVVGEPHAGHEGPDRGI